MNKIAVVLMVKNEADIIESMVRHALQYADFMLVKDHQSTDDTRKILDAMTEEGLPLKVYDCDYVGHNQKEVMTELLYQAFDEGADLVVPSDADEFLIWEEHTSKELRKLLQTLPTDCSYSLKWINFALKDENKNTDKYILSREVCKSSEDNNMPKCIVGRELAIKTHGHLTQGNHGFCAYDSDVGMDYVDSSTFKTFTINLYVAHFPWRSDEQCISKSICGWLTNISAFGIDSFYARGWKNKSDKYLRDGIVSRDGIGNITITSALSKYNSECSLHYTSCNVNPIKNVIRLTEVIADNYAIQTVLNLKKTVTTISIYDGDINKFKRTFSSLLQQTYPFNKYIILSVTNNEIDTLVQYIENVDIDEEICLVDIYTNWQDEIRGEYIQILESGCVIDTEKILRQIVFLEKHEICMIVVCGEAGRNGKFTQRNIENTGMSYIKSFEEILNQCNKSNSGLVGGISGALFNKKVLMDMEWMNVALQYDDVSKFDFWRKVLGNEKYKSCAYVGMIDAELVAV